MTIRKVMDYKYILFIAFLIPGILSIIRGMTYRPPKGNEEHPDITALGYIIGGSLALTFAVFILIYG